MTDTPRTLDALLALAADNAVGDFSAQDLRDFMVSADYWKVQSMWRSPINLPGATDILWDGDDAAGMTTVTVTGTQTVTEGKGQLSVAFEDQASLDFNCILAAKTISVGDIWSMPLRIFEAGLENYCLAGLVMTDGTTSAANAVSCYWYLSVNAGAIQINIEERRGTLTNMATATTSIVTGESALPVVWCRIKYQAANSFNVSWSPDGISYISEVNVTPTITPTHVGPFWSAFGGGTNGIRVASFGPLHKTT